MTYDQFDVKGNLLQYHKENDSFTSVIWSYNYQYPVAEIKNASYATIIGILGASSLNTFNASIPSKAAIETFIAPLKTALPNAQITTYSHIPLVGVSSISDAKGLTTYYEYDGFQRLKNIKDQNGNVIKNNIYHYKSL